VPPWNRQWCQDASGTAALLPSLLPGAGRLAMSGLPGYTGYIPGKVAENVHGCTFQCDNERATGEVEKLRRGFGTPPVLRAPGPAAGTEIPGYMGFVPGRIAENTLGQSLSRCAETAWLQQERNRQEGCNRVQAYRLGQRPPTGHIDYAGYHGHAAPPGVDARLSD